MGTAHSALQQCIEGVGNGRTDFAGFPSSPVTYQSFWVRPYNLDISVNPAGVVRPQTASEVSGIIKCAAAHNVKVQARSGGHSYGNYGIGGADGALVIDLVNFQQFSMDNSTWQATVGAGTRLGQMSENLHNAGGRAITHAVCPGVGVGGHATIGGLGPTSRMWGSTLDHVVEVEVVTADGEIRRANSSQNSDLFWALRGAASGFGVITEFVFKTHPEPGDIVQYEYNVKFGNPAEIAPFYSKWQDMIADPELDRRLGTIFIMLPFGAIITGDFYGTKEELKATGILDMFPQPSESTLVVKSWLGALANSAQKENLYLSDLPVPFYSKSIGFKREDLPTADKIQDLFQWVNDQDKGTVAWAIIFDATGGAVGDVPTNATSFVHRDKILYYQSYAVGLPLSQKSKDFITNFHNEVVGKCSPKAYGTYPGYVDPKLLSAQQQYWESNLPRLREVKKIWDPTDLFHNPQSVKGVE
ncbi:hypothetical protein CHGG_03670 [Chaetomium globosum CBS 148.51]|uniref:FAD-binding PCMH-type domain-containing protein n=1 Tax=Chaetomium globosum (strain ATCC 6205 / CBS 148.51 / DSM 1962 / NBRC 6347 / NRRL 1970) TaxID=306901 RepID=Q2H7Y4_CHAGB|nr:uncharacterized protein CHGG_03670 [Chaetomium globosum CBS 148.51]EAQ91735.1 hypothetical protein CHGG_03670 [Chaetomium globosum CBS 148.51]